MEYQDATFYFYTGTGNSYRVATWLAGAVREKGTPVKVSSIRSASPSEEIGAGKASLLGLVMPTHGFTTPWAMLRFALRLPRRGNTHAVVIATRAGSRIGSLYTPGFEGTATLLVTLILTLKGYRVRGTAGIDMPSNWIALHPGLSPDTVSGIVARAQRKAQRFMEAILSGERYFTWMMFMLGLLVLPISLAYLAIGRLFLGKIFFASDRCTGCGLCAEHCPNQAIEMRNTKVGPRPYWTFRCESCVRCMAYCPVQAVEASHLLAVGVYFLANLIPLVSLLIQLAARVPALAFLGKTPGWLIAWVNIIIVLDLLYPIFHLSLRVREFNWFFTHATLTHYYRRYHEPSTSLKDLS